MSGLGSLIKERGRTQPGFNWELGTWGRVGLGIQINPLGNPLIRLSVWESVWVWVYTNNNTDHLDDLDDLLIHPTGTINLGNPINYNPINWSTNWSGLGTDPIDRPIWSDWWNQQSTITNQSIWIWIWTIWSDLDLIIQSSINDQQRQQSTGNYQRLTNQSQSNPIHPDPIQDRPIRTINPINQLIIRQSNPSNPDW